MSEQLNIKRILPLGRPPLEVRGAEKRKKNRPDKQFEKQLYKEEKEKKKKKWKSDDEQEPRIDTAPLNKEKEISKADHKPEVEGHKTIDILV